MEADSTAGDRCTPFFSFYLFFNFALIPSVLLFVMINFPALCLLRPPYLDLRHDIILFLFLLLQMGAGYELCFLSYSDLMQF